MAKNVYFEEIYDGVLCEAAESFQAKIKITSKEYREKTVEKSRFVELSEDDLENNLWPCPGTNHQKRYKMGSESIWR